MQQRVRAYRCTIQPTQSHCEGAAGSARGEKRNGRQAKGGKQKLKRKGRITKKREGSWERGRERERAVGSMLE